MEEMVSDIPALINQEEKLRLESPISEEEVKNAIWSLHPDKAPGPDGFPICFYRSFWSLIKKYLLRLITWMAKGNMGGATNSTFLALIPKEPNPSSIKKFRPISLCNASYKIFSKVLSLRLKKIIPSLISPNQGGFLSGRQISDNILLVQEAIHSSSKRGEPGMAIKLDLANAFDRLRHSFIILVLKSFGFPETFILQVQACITSPWIAPLINGRPSAFFKASRGVRQGCPLSPFLYILVADSLSRRLNRLQAEGSLPGLSFRGSVPPINHALFADDTILLGIASPQIARNFLRPLDIFLKSSGSSVNLQKSQIYGWNCPSATLCSISQILKIKFNPN